MTVCFNSKLYCGCITTHTEMCAHAEHICLCKFPPSECSLEKQIFVGQKHLSFFAEIRKSGKIYTTEIYSSPFIL